MQAFRLIFAATLLLSACKGAEQESAWNDVATTSNPAGSSDPFTDERQEPEPQDDDDSAGGPDDDDSAGGPDDDDSAGEPATLAVPAPATALATPAAPVAATPVPAQPGFVPPPPGKKGPLERAAALMMGTRFRWVQGSKDVAYGLYGAPVMLNLWSCTDRKIDDNLEWMTAMEKDHSDQMLSILVPANVAERSLTGQDNICGRSIRFGRSFGVDVGKGVMEELKVDELPTTIIFNAQGEEITRHEGVVAVDSSAAKKLEQTLLRELAPLSEGRALAP